MQVSGILYTLEQFAAALSLLAASGAAAGLRHFSPVRLVFTAWCAALGATLTAMYPSPILRGVLLLLLLLSPIAAWPGIPRFLRFRMPLIALALSLTIAGCVRFLQGFPLLGCLAVMASCWLLPAFIHLLPRHTAPRCATVEIRHHGCRITLTALVDTGNLLRDPLTHLPVVIVSRRAAERLTSLPMPGELTPGMRYISVRTVSGSSLMTIFRPESVRLLQGRTWQNVQAMIGLSPDGYDGVQALVPASLTQPVPSSAS